MPVTYDKLIDEALLHKHKVDDINATGTADNTTYLRGDGVWEVPVGAGLTVSDTSSVDLTLSTGDLSADVLPGGVDHDQLLNVHQDVNTTASPTFQATSYDVLYTPTGSEPVGSVYWNSVNGTLNIVLNNGSILDMGQEMYFYGKASGAIANGDLVQFAGVQGDHILMKKAVNTEVIANPSYFIGVATQNIANGAFGYVTWFGYVDNVYTKTPANQDNADWITGDILYFSNTTGQLTKTEPQAPEVRIQIAAVVRVQTGASETGKLIVRPHLGQKLIDLDDVNGTTPTTTGQVLAYDAINGYWDVSDIVNDHINNTSNPHSVTASQLGAVTTDQTVGQTIGTTGARLTKLWATDITVTNAISGSITGNSATVTTNANLTGPITSVGNATSIASQTGTGTKFVMDTSPTLVTPVLGVATATSINKVVITAPATGSTLTIADGKTLTASNTLTFTGTDTSSVAFGTGGAVVYTSNKLSALSATTSAELAGVISDETGTGSLVFGTSPTFTTNISTPSIIGSGAIGITPNSGSNLNITLATTGDFVVNTDQLYVDTSAGFVGIGTTSPTGKLEVQGGASVFRYDTNQTTPNIFTILNLDNTASTLHGAGFTFYLAQTGQTTALPSAKIVSGKEIEWTTTGSTNDSFLSFETKINGTLAEKMRIDSSGNVGIGTTAPAGLLDIAGSAGNIQVATTGAHLNFTRGSANYIKATTAGGTLRFNINGNADGSPTLYLDTSGNVNIGGTAALTTPTMIVQASGNVGIGTTSPADKLVVIGTGSFTGALQLVANSTIPAAGAAFYRPASNTLGFVTASTERARIDASGNVGIGTTSPGAKLDISSTTATEARLTSTSTGYSPQLSFYNGATLGGFLQYRGSTVGSDPNMMKLGSYVSGGQVQIVTGVGANAMRIDSSGNVGIGTTSPADKLVVIGTGSFTGALQLSANSTIPAAGAAFYRPASNTLGFVTASTERARIDASGNVGIGTVSPTEKLDINSDAIRIRTAQTPASAGAAGNQGDICWDSSYIYICISTNTWHRAAHATW